MSKIKFQVTFNAEFDTSELDTNEMKELNNLTPEQLKEKIDDGFVCGSYDFFGESLSMLGLLTPEVNSVREIK